jgi:hypothetical protein
MQAVGDIRPRLRLVHMPVENGSADGKIRIACSGPRCVAWNPRPCESRREAQFWYDKHISQPLIYHLW